MYNLSYGERLLGLESLQVRRLRSDLVMYFKIMHGYVDQDFTDFFKINVNRKTRKNLPSLTSNWKTNFNLIRLVTEQLMIGTDFLTKLCLLS